MKSRDDLIFDLIQKYGQLYVTQIINLAHIKRPTVLKVLDRLYENKKISFILKQNRKVYHVLKKGSKNYDERQEEDLIEIQKLQTKVNKAIQLFQKKPDQISLEALIQLATYILQWKSIITIYKHGFEIADMPNSWNEIDLVLTKEYSKIIKQEPIMIRTELLKTQSISCKMIDSSIDGTLKYLSLSKKELNDFKKSLGKK